MSEVQRISAFDRLDRLSPARGLQRPDVEEAAPMSPAQGSITQLPSGDYLVPTSFVYGDPTPSPTAAPEIVIEHTVTNTYRVSGLGQGDLSAMPIQRLFGGSAQPQAALPSAAAAPTRQVQQYRDPSVEDFFMDEPVEYEAKRPKSERHIPKPILRLMMGSAGMVVSGGLVFGATATGVYYLVPKIPFLGMGHNGSPLVAARDIVGDIGHDIYNGIMGDGK